MREYDAYRAVYCGLCKQLKKSCGAFSRMYLSYDMTFMALLGIAANSQQGKYVTGRCMLNPFYKRGFVTEDRSIELTAYTSVLLVYYKLKDDLADEGFWGRLKAAVALLPFSFMHRRAAKAQPELDSFIKNQLRCLSDAEKQGGLTLDGYSDIFAKILAEAFKRLSADEKTSRVLENIGYNTGKWIYVLDAAADIDEDLSRHRFNALLAAYPLLKNESAEEYKLRMKPFLAQYLTDITVMIKAASELLAYCSCRGIAENIIELGMPAAAAAVLDGQKVRKRRN